MKKLYESIGRWIEQADADDISGVVIAVAFATVLILFVIGEAFKG